MSGGGSSKKKDRKKDEPTQAEPAMVMQPSFMPGMDSMLAQQLSMGGYGDPNTLLAAFSPIFTPMQIQDMRPGATPTPTTPAPATPQPNNPAPTTPGLNLGGNRGVQRRYQPGGHR